MPDDPREAYYHERMRDAGSHYSGFDSLSSEVSLNLLYSYDVYHQHSARFMSEFGLSKSTLNILMLLRHGPEEGMQLHDLGALLLVSRANITGLIDHMESKEYVRRIVDASDRRARFARITEKGELLLDRYLPIHFVYIKCMMQDLSIEEKALLVGLLKKMRVSFAAHAHQGCNTCDNNVSQLMG